MASIILRCGLGALASIVILTFSASAIAQTGFAWGNQPTANNYAPNPAFSYNSRGGAVTISRGGVGEYKVNFVGLGGRGTPGGNVQVTAYGADPVTCNVAQWQSNQNDFTVLVRCFKYTGSPVDYRYTVLVGWWGQ